MDLFSGLIVIGALTQSVRARNFKAWRTPFNYFFVLAVVHVALSYYWNQVPWEFSGPGLAEFRWIIVLLAFKIAWDRVSDSQFRWFLIPLALAGFYSVLTYALGFSPLHQTWGDREANLSYIWRTGGFMNDAMGWSQTAGPLAAVLLGTSLFFATHAKSALSHRATWALGAVTGLMLLTVLFTMTRGVWIGLALGVPLALATLNWKRGLLTGAAIAILAIAVVALVPPVRSRVISTLDYQKTHDSERLVLWRANGEMVKEHPWFGLGYGENRRRLREYYDRLEVRAGQFESHAHNQYIQFASGTGIPGALLYLAFMGATIVLAVRLRREAEVRGEMILAAVLLGTTAGALTFALDGLTEANFSIAKNRYLFVLLAGLVLSRWRPELWRFRKV